MKSYHGPLISTNIENPYVFLLYNHSVPINVTQELADTIINMANKTALKTFLDGVGLKSKF